MNKPIETNIIKRDGSKEPLDINKMHFVVEQACEGLTGVSASQIEMNSHIQFTNNMTSKDIQDILIRSANDLISSSKGVIITLLFFIVLFLAGALLLSRIPNTIKRK